LQQIKVFIEIADNNAKTNQTDWEFAMQKKVKLKKYNLMLAKLMQVILIMSEEQQQEIFKHANELVNGDRRIFDRKACHLRVDFATSDRTHKGHIQNISHLGVFIEAKAPIMIGEEVLMVFKVNRDSKDVKLKGEVAHATRWGLGIEFTAKGPRFDRHIRNIIQRIQ
jgi:Tfp pilus assembly protein PilZ